MRRVERSRAHTRRGATLVETAIVLSTFFIFVFGIIEMSRLGMVAQLLTDAAREGCRIAILDGKSPLDVTTSKLGDWVTVTITVSFSDVSWLPVPRFLGSATLMSSATMSSERLLPP